MSTWSGRAISISLVATTVLFSAACDLGPDPAPRTVTIETREVTSPDVAVSPDGQTLVFSLLGHLFRLPVEGGTAEQLTFGPFYDEDPAFSPDGTRLAFASDRGRGEGDLFVLTLETGEMDQVTDEFWAARPAWSNDSGSLAYLSYEVGSVRCTGNASVRRITLAGGESRALSDGTRPIRSVGFTSEGRLAWVRHEPTESGTQSVIEVLRDDGEADIVATVDGQTDRMVLGADSALWVHRTRPWVARGELVRVRSGQAPVPVADVSRRYCTHRQPRFAVSPGGESAFLGEEGKLWRYDAGTGARDSIPFVARVEFSLSQASGVPETDPAAQIGPIEITHPQRTATGEGLLFGALGKVWWQAGEGSPAEPLTLPGRIERNPVLAPDGERVALIDATESRHEIVVTDLAGRRRTSLLEGSYFWDLVWRPDGSQLLVSSQVHSGNVGTFSILGVDPVTAEADTLVREIGSFFFPPRPHFSDDGNRLFYTAYEDRAAHVYSLGRDSGGESAEELIASLPFHLSNIQVSPRMDWIGFRRNSELLISPLDRNAAQVSEESAVTISAEGGRSFRFSGADAVIYAEDGEVWEYDIPSATRRLLPVRLTAASTPAPPLLIDRIRLLDFEAGGFTEETSILLRDGRIEKKGLEAASNAPPGVQHLDAEGRFALPGLIEPHMHSEAPWWLLSVDQRAYIANGITTVRDVGEPLQWVKPLAQRSLLSSDPVPRYLFTGDMLQHYVLGIESGGVGYAESSTLVYDEETARSSIRRLKAAGVHAIKAYASLPMSLHRAVSDEARAQGLPVVAHGANVKEMVRAIGLGYQFAEHLDGPSRFYEDLQRLLAAAGTYWTPTLSIMGGTAVLFLPPEAMETDRGRFFQLLHENELGDLAGGREHSVNLLIATDNPEVGGVGQSYHGEMQAFVLAGFTPLEVLEIATRRSAVALGAGRSLGTLEPGKLADLVILNEDPLEDITNTRGIWRVVKAGRVFDPADLRDDPSD